MLVRGGRPRFAIEVKRSTAPTVGAGFRRAVSDLGVEDAWIVTPDTGAAHPLGAGVTAMGVTEMVTRLRAQVRP